MCECSESQIYKRLREPQLKAKYEEARKNLLAQATTTLQSNLTMAVDTMTEIMSNGNASPQTRLNAADSVIRNAIKMTELVDLTERIEALERSIAVNED